MSGSQALLPTPVGVHDPENPDVAAAGLADEGDPRFRLRACGARPSGERGRRRLGLRAPVDYCSEHDRNQRDERHDCPVPPMATTLLSPRLLDQRLDEGLDLLTVERPAVRNLGRW